MLRHLVAHGVFTEPRPGQFTASQAAALLRTCQPGAVWLDLDGFGGRMDLAFAARRTPCAPGEQAWEQVYGLPFAALAWTPTPRSAPPSTRPWRWTPTTPRWRMVMTDQRCDMWPTSAAGRSSRRCGGATRGCAARWLTVRDREAPSNAGPAGMLAFPPSARILGVPALCSGTSAVVEQQAAWLPGATAQAGRVQAG